MYHKSFDTNLTPNHLSVVDYVNFILVFKFSVMRHVLRENDLHYVHYLILYERHAALLRASVILYEKYLISTAKILIFIHLIALHVCTYKS